MTIAYRKLGHDDVSLYRGLNEVFAVAFDDTQAHRPKTPPSDSYLRGLLSKEHFIAIVAIREGKVVGGLVAYLLEKYVEGRSEVYLYDLAVAESHRRQGVARNLIQELRSVARELGAWVIFVQADREDAPAIRLYESLGIKEEPLHFDIPLDGSS